MEFALTHGVRIAYEDSGKGEPAVVLLHAPFGRREQLAAIAEHLAGRHRVIALDMRGTGASGAPPSAYRIDDYAEDVRAVCRAAGVDHAVLCGHSLGGAIALRVGALDPGLVAGVALLDAAILYPEPLRKQLLDQFVPALEGPGRLEALRGFFAARMFGPFDPPELRNSILHQLSSLPAEMPATLMRDSLTYDAAADIEAGKYPLLYLHAQFPAELERLRSLRPDVIAGAVAGSGHFLAQVVPDQVNAVLDRFLAVLPQAAVLRG